MASVPVDAGRDGVEEALWIPGGKRGDFSWKHAGPERKWSEAGMIKADGIDFASFSHNNLVTMQSNEGEWVANGEFM